MILLLIAILVFLIAMLVFYLNIMFVMIRSEAPYISSSAWAVSWIADHIQVPDGATVIDLGCGDGRVLRALWKKHPTIHPLGYEVGWVPYVFGKMRSRRTPVQILFRDMFRADTHSADLVFAFLSSKSARRLSEKLRRELRPGAQVITCDFPLPDWTPVEIIKRPPDTPRHGEVYTVKTIYTYRKS